MVKLISKLKQYQVARLKGDIKRVMEAFHECGVPKELALQIIYELLGNCDLYAGNEAAIDELLLSKLDINTYITIRSYFIVE